MPEDETLNGDYEMITYRYFKASDKDRRMRWKGGSGRIAVGSETIHTTTDNDTGTLLHAGQTLVVSKTHFKLSSS